MPEYDRDRFDPPAPVARVTIRHPGTGATISEVPMLLDTGADVTLLPLSYVQRLGLKVESNQGYELTGFDGSRSIAPSVELHMVFMTRVFRGRFIVIDQDWGIMGRNVLNNVSLLLDGRRLIWNDGS